MSKIQTNPVKVIREKCIDCCCGSVYEVAKCTAEKCPLWPWRMGKNPYRKPPSEAQREVSRLKMQKLQQQRAANVDSEP
jgi:hypothetical protein